MNLAAMEKDQTRKIGLTFPVLLPNDAREIFMSNTGLRYARYRGVNTRHPASCRGH